MTDPKATKPQEAAKTFGRERLSPGAYFLNLEQMKLVSVKLNGEQTTLADAYCRVRDAKVKKIPLGFAIDAEEYETENGNFVVGSDWKVLSTIRKLLSFDIEGINPFLATWYYYGNDWSRDADEIHVFFATCDSKIVRESEHFNSEAPMVLQMNTDDEHIWHSEPYFSEAADRYWYRRFYTETLTGQLMVLRPDEPTLYYFERAQVNELGKELQLATLGRIYHLLWVVLPLLAATAYAPTREIMLIIAAILGLDFLRVCWVTRNAGMRQSN